MQLIKRRLPALTVVTKDRRWASLRDLHDPNIPIFRRYFIPGQMSLYISLDTTWAVDSDHCVGNTCIFMGGYFERRKTWVLVQGGLQGRNRHVASLLRRPTRNEARTEQYGHQTDRANACRQHM